MKAEPSHIFQSDAINLTASDFDLFWDEVKEGFRLDGVDLSAKRTRENHALIEYVIKCEWYSDYEGGHDSARAVVRMQAIPENRQCLSLVLCEPPFDPQFPVDYEPRLNNKGMTDIYTAFVERLGQKGWKELSLSSTNGNSSPLTQDATPTKIHRPIKAMTRAQTNAQKAKQLRNAGNSIKEIARELGCSVRTVSRYLDKTTG